MSQPRGAANGAPCRSEGMKPQESWWSGDGPSHLFAPQYPEAQAGLDVKPQKGERGGAAIKVSARTNGRMLWRDQTQEGIDGRNPRVPVAVRTRCGNKALKPARLWSPTSGKAASSR
jgi:hypothetical protein